MRYILMLCAKTHVKLNRQGFKRTVGHGFDAYPQFPKQGWFLGFLIQQTQILAHRKDTCNATFFFKRIWFEGELRINRIDKAGLTI